MQVSARRELGFYERLSIEQQSSSDPPRHPLGRLLRRTEAGESRTAAGSTAGGKLSFDERLSVERQYIENSWLSRDLKIIGLALGAVVSGGGVF